MIEAYSMRKIPMTHKEQDNTLLDDSLDKIKILEISNFIDEWEKELLFSENGFYSLKGKEVENKTKIFIENLETFINSKINEISFINSSSRILLNDVKEKKLNAIRMQMQKYENIQIKNWEIEVYENSIKSSIQRAVLYKKSNEIIESSFQNGLAVLEIISEKEKWNSKTYTVKKNLYEADFYYELINSFLLEKDARASFYFEKFKNKLKDKDKSTLEKAVIILKNNIVAYNWAKELFSYDFPDDRNEQEIKEVKNNEIEVLIRKYLLDFKNDKKKSDSKQKQEKNEKNWLEIVSLMEKQTDNAEMYIDYTLDKESINSKKMYIKNMRKNGFIITDKTVFIDLFSKIFEQFEIFKKEDISNYRKDLSADDYRIIEEMQSLSQKEFVLLLSDYKYIKSKLCEKGILGKEEIYGFIKTIFKIKEDYISKNKEEPDIEKRNKLIDSLLERYINK